MHSAVEGLWSRLCVLLPNQEVSAHQETSVPTGEKLVEWKVTDVWDEENNRLFEGRTVLIYKGGDRKDPANYRPITCLPTITKMVTLAIHKRMRRWLLERRKEHPRLRAAGSLNFIWL